MFKDIADFLALTAAGFSVFEREGKRACGKKIFESATSSLRWNQCPLCGGMVVQFGVESPPNAAKNAWAEGDFETLGAILTGEAVERLTTPVSTLESGN